MGDTERRDEIVRDLERWYFGETFREYRKKTEVGEWRDIVNEAAMRLVKAERELAIAELEQLAVHKFWCSSDHQAVSYSGDIEKCPLCKAKRELAEARKAWDDHRECVSDIDEFSKQVRREALLEAKPYAEHRACRTDPCDCGYAELFEQGGASDDR